MRHVQCARCAKHQFGLLRVHAQAGRVTQKGDEHPASPRIEGCAGGQQRRTAHVAGGSRFTAHHGDIAKTAFMTGLRRLRAQRRVRAVCAQQPRAGLDGGRDVGLTDAKIIEPHLARTVAAAGGEQARLQSQQTQGK